VNGKNIENQGQSYGKSIRWLGGFHHLGAMGMRSLDNFGAATLFFMESLYRTFHRHQFKAIVQQLYFIGVRTTAIIVLIGLFTGMVLGLQLFYTLSKFGSVGALGSAVALSLIRELGPVLTAVMITARAGSAMTAEIGIQRISEQIDALTTMRIDPVAYLISPRIVAALFSFPILTALFDLIGIAGGYLTGVVLAGANAGSYYANVQSSISMSDINGGFVKSLVFAALVSTVCCFHGFYTHMQSGPKGAKGVSLSTTSAVVQSCVFILIADYLITSFLL